MSDEHDDEAPPDNEVPADALPCPFCGGRDLEYSGDLNAICCQTKTCLASGPDVNEETEALAWAKWNARNK